MRFLIYVTAWGLVTVPTLLLAQVMQSTNYQIQADSVNLGGGFSTSTAYTLESTVGEIATGDSSSVTYGIRAGYQQMVSSYIALSGGANISLLPSLPGITGGTSNGSTTVTVITDSTAGYQLTVEAENNPAMQSSASTIPDYVPVGGDPDFSFDVDAGEAYLGYSPEGVDVVSRFLDNGSNTCGIGSAETTLACWDGLATTPEVIASGSNPNHPLGATTTIRFRVGIGGSVGQAPGIYIATTTVTALAL